MFYASEGKAGTLVTRTANQRGKGSSGRVGQRWGEGTAGSHQAWGAGPPAFAPWRSPKPGHRLPGRRAAGSPGNGDAEPWHPLPPLAEPPASSALRFPSFGTLVCYFICRACHWAPTFNALSLMWLNKLAKEQAAGI